LIGGCAQAVETTSNKDDLYTKVVLQIVGFDTCTWVLVQVYGDEHRLLNQRSIKNIE